LASDGIHSNGLTLARRVLFDHARLAPTTFVDELGTTVGEELLKPTRIYVRPILTLLQRMPVKALVHITGGGVRNLLRVQTPCTFVLDAMPEPPPIFSLLQRLGDIADAEMFTTFNMGIGFCVVVPSDHADKALQILREAGERAQVIGQVATLGERQVQLPQRRLVIAPERQ
jgi:phosphoribosylformylglycinamidine cyclo-ligase